MNAKQWDIEWHDHEREPQCVSDPRFPNGIEFDLSDGQEQACTAELPYPAKRCGVYRIECLLCGTSAAVTTAGRPDDPKSLKLPCTLKGKPDDGRKAS